MIFGDKPFCFVCQKNLQVVEIQILLNKDTERILTRILIGIVRMRNNQRFEDKSLIPIITFLGNIWMMRGQTEMKIEIMSQICIILAQKTKYYCIFSIVLEKYKIFFNYCLVIPYPLEKKPFGLIKGPYCPFFYPVYLSICVSVMTLVEFHGVSDNIRLFGP